MVYNIPWGRTYHIIISYSYLISTIASSNQAPRIIYWMASLWRLVPVSHKAWPKYHGNSETIKIILPPFKGGPVILKKTSTIRMHGSQHVDSLLISDPKKNNCPQWPFQSTCKTGMKTLEVANPQNQFITHVNYLKIWKWMPEAVGTWKI